MKLQNHFASLFVSIFCLAALALASGCVSRVKDGSVADIPVPPGVSKAEAAFVVAASLVTPGHAVFEQTVAAVPRELASSLKAYNDGKDSGNVRFAKDGAINVQRNLHYVKIPLGHGIDPALWDYVAGDGVIKHRFQFAVDSKRVRAFIEALDSQIRANLTRLQAAKGVLPAGAAMTAPTPAATFAPASPVPAAAFAQAPASAFAPAQAATSAQAPVAGALPAPSGNGLYFAYNPATPDSVVREAIGSAARARKWAVVSEVPGSMRLEYKGYTLTVSYGGGGVMIDHPARIESWAKALQTQI
ncbi:MAG: hypothetical protein LBM92_07495 [Opitutaceae bacterium]|nr:hypothetical protein [Opitutaceae bacterium]